MDQTKEMNPEQQYTNVRHIISDGIILAVIVSFNENEIKPSNEISFFTPDTFSQQIGYMSRPKGYIIPPHVHNPVSREVLFTKEVLFIKSGKLRVDFYRENQSYIQSHIVKQGDILLLAHGGHGFEMIEPSEIIEVKQGPYAGDKDKTRFKGIDHSQALIKP